MTAGWVVFGVGMLGVATTVVPFVPSNEWWIRIWDFPRIQVAVLLAAVLAGIPLTLPVRRRRTILFAAGVAAALGWQVMAILPYTPILPTEAKATARCEPESRIRLLVANALKLSREIEPLLSLVGRLGPDVVILPETNAYGMNSLVR